MSASGPACSHARTPADHGSGVSFRESLELGDLQSRRLGPVSLKRRVEIARGTTRIDSSSEGATVHVSIPVNGAGP